MNEQKGSLKTILPLVKEKPQFTGISKTNGVLVGGYGVHKKYTIMIIREYNRGGHGSLKPDLLPWRPYLSRLPNSLIN